MPMSVTMVPADASALMTSPVEKFFMMGSPHPLRTGAHDRDERADGAGRGEDPHDDSCLHVVLLRDEPEPVAPAVRICHDRASRDFA